MGDRAGATAVCEGDGGCGLCDTPQELFYLSQSTEISFGSRRTRKILQDDVNIFRFWCHTLHQSYHTSR